MNSQIPESRNIDSINRESDMSVKLTFCSCRSASAFIRTVKDDWHRIHSGQASGGSAVSELVDAVAGLYSGKAMKGDQTEVAINGHIVWLAQQAQKELRAGQRNEAAS